MPHHAGCGRCLALRRTAPARGRSPSARCRGATCQLRPPTSNRRPRVKRSQAGLRSLSLGRTLSTRACCAHAAPRWLWASMCHKGRRTDERPLSFSARPWRDAPTTAINTRLAAACQASAGASAHALWGGGEACELAMHALRREEYGRRRCLGRTAPARGHLQSSRGSGAMCQLWPPMPN